MKFKIGDEVRVLGSHYNKGLVGKIGTVRKTTSYYCIVELKGWEHGHDGDLNLGNSGWFLTHQNLQLVKDKKLKCVPTGKTKITLPSGVWYSIYAEEVRVEGISSNKDYVHILGVYSGETLRILDVYKDRKEAKKESNKLQSKFGKDYKFVVLEKEVK